MWEAYRAAHPGSVAAASAYTVEFFGDSVELANELLALVTHGPKRATAALVEEFAEEAEPLPRIGSHWIACDGSGAPVIVIRSTELRIGTFDSVDAAFAYDEGEDDRSLESWRREHRRYWERTRSATGREFTPEHEIVLERFTVVWPPELAD
ncbi:ASCH domain-containing protein [Pseudoclavibacter sp. AY1F1]|uniref:ASCH domain-containing protein n=1 Tax=Pseudoclavibacter sp. AY1F1 TaxID=2080583 RepID=UPI000CE813CA|nr:ASCH domain-containing protein [Pseudoclavibacter sp. AY1F1]PPF42946.1 ASCH domain-containing protein [Pseudoclavibacter sp. AY1F1]